MEDIVRVGVISSVDTASGMAQVYYEDRGCTTDFLHLFAFRAEYAPPAVGDSVVVLHLSNDTSSGIILGRYWGSADPPPAGVDYWKEAAPGFTDSVEKGVRKICGSEIMLSGNAGSVTLSSLIDLQKRVEALERG